MTGPGSRERPQSAAPRAAVIVNPGNVDVLYLRAVVEAQEVQCGWQPSLWFQTTIHEPGQVAARAALQHDPALMIVVGGDGTIRAVAEGMHTSRIPLGIVPTGTGNLLARNLGLMSGVDSAVHTAFTGTDRTIDVGCVGLEHQDRPARDHVFLVMTGVGLDASMAAHTNSALKKRIGWLAYTDPISRSVLANKQFSIHYRADGGREHSLHAHTTIIGNCGTLAASILLLPNLFARGIAVKVLDGIAAGEHTERNLILDLALALAEDRRRDIVRKTRNGLDAARKRGRTGGRPRVVDTDKRRIIIARHLDGESIRTIAGATKLSIGTVHTVITEHRGRSSSL